MDSEFKQKVVDRKFVIEEYIRKQTMHKFVTKEIIERIIYQVNILECGHDQRIRNDADRKCKTTTCYSCMKREYFKESLDA